MKSDNEYEILFAQPDDFTHNNEHQHTFVIISYGYSVPISITFLLPLPNLDKENKTFACQTNVLYPVSPVPQIIQLRVCAVWPPIQRVFEWLMEHALHTEPAMVTSV